MALALRFSTTKFGYAASGDSAHAKKVDVALNNTMRIISGCLKPTNIKHLPQIYGIAPPEVRREVAADAERATMEMNSHHIMYWQKAAASRPKSQNSFLTQTVPIIEEPSDADCQRERRYPMPRRPGMPIRAWLSRMDHAE